VCSAYAAQTKAILQPRSYTQIERYVAKTLPLYKAALRQLEALKPPPRDATAVQAWLAADRSVAKAVTALGEGARRRDFPAVTAAAARAQLAGSESRQAAADLGMHVCAQLATSR
jgi:hypothetical protein